MNLEKEIGNSLEFMTNGGTSEIHRSDDGTIVARPTPVRMGATGMNLQPPIRRELSQAEPQTFEQTKKDIVPTLVGLPAGATAATLGTLQDIAGLIYGGVKAMGAEEGQKMQTFLDTAGEISDKYGSGAVKGYIRQKAEEAGLDDDQLKVLDEAMMIGEFGGIGGMAKAAVTKGPQMLSKAGDMVEGAGDAAKARMAEGGATLTSGVDPDPLIAAAGDAVAKFRAPTEKQPGIIAFHGSGADFDEFKLEKIGTGEGAQAYGYGLYFTDSEDIAKFYKDTVQFNQRMRGNTLNINYQGKPFKDLGDTATAEAAPPSYTAIKSIADEMAAYLPANPKMAKPELAKERLLTRIDSEIEKYSKAGQPDADVGTIELQGGGTLEELLLADLQQRKQALLDINSDDIQPATGKMYKVGLAPKPDELLNYQTTFAEQPKKVQDALKAIGYEVETDRAGLKNPPIVVEAAMTRPMPMVLNYMKGVVSDTAKAPINKEISSINDKMRSLAKIMDEYEISYRKYSDPKGQEAAEEYDQLMDKRQELVNKMASSPKADKLLSEKLLEQGVPGLKYRAAGSRGANVDAADAEMNYVIFDDNMIKILEKYGIVGPVAITGIAASKQESEPDAGA